MSRRNTKNKKVNPKIYIFCEGESEEVYISYLKSKYRLPVEVVIFTETQITARLIKSHPKKTEKHVKDRIYLMYDLDVKTNLQKLIQITKQIKCELLISNPCFELWYVLHYTDQNSEISTNNCIRKIEDRVLGYKKGAIGNKLKLKLDSNGLDAKKRAEKLITHKNPSTNIFELINYFEAIRKMNDENN